MSIPTTTQEFDEVLDIFGQSPRIQIYTQLALCYELKDGVSISAITETLNNGLERLTASFPWVAGQVINEGANETSSGSFRIRPLERIPRLVVKDLRDDPNAPTMHLLREKDFPMNSLDESLIASRRTIPNPQEETPFNFPVFNVQANFITDGLILAFIGLHSVMDMTGQAEVMRLLCKACRNEPFTTDEISTGNLPRANIIPLLDPSETLSDETAYWTANPSPPNPSAAPGNPSPPPHCVWANLSFSGRSLAKLKTLAQQSLASGYVSTDDVLSAFIWQLTLRARTSRLAADTPTQFARAVDPRRYIGLPRAYTGLVQNMTFHRLPLSTLLRMPLGAVAADLRAAVDPATSNVGHSTRALATALSKAEDRRAFNVMSRIHSATDVILSSWSAVQAYEMDFGLGLGVPEAARRPAFTPVESLMYLLPRRGDGEVVVAVALREEDLEKVREDGEFKTYGKYVG
jgi:trichothecene 3-O-acetyltransferase